MTDKQICPLCETQNNCQVKDPTKPCWCTAITFPEQLNEKLTELSERCICSTCAEKLGATQKQP